MSINYIIRIYLLDYHFFKRFYFFFREKEKKVEREDRNINKFPPTDTPSRDQVLSPGMCLYQESSRQPFSLGRMPISLSHTGQGKITTSCVCMWWT